MSGFRGSLTCPNPPTPPQAWDVFSFTAPPTPLPPPPRNNGKRTHDGQPWKLSFSDISSSSQIFFSPQCQFLHPKRRRPLADVDGERSGAAQIKKRRLRFSFVTSRLSRPFSNPPTHIIARGSSKIAVWAKQKALGRSSLRRAAIMNRLRQNALSTRYSEPHRFEIARWTFMYDYLITPSTTAATAVTTTTAGSPPTTNITANRRPPSLPLPKPPAPPPRPPPHALTADQLAQVDKLISQSASSQPSCLRRTRRPVSPSPSPPSPQTSPRKQYIPLPSSPFSLTNYDVFDNEDGYFDSSDGDAEDSDGDSPSGSNTTSPQNGLASNTSYDNSSDTPISTKNSKTRKKNGKGNRVYSDFNVLEPSEPVIDDDHDSLSAFDSLPFWGRWLPEVGSEREDEKQAEMMLEKERQKEVSFVKFEC